MDRLDGTIGAGGSSWIRKVVVAADGSPASLQGLERAADLAVRLGAKVVVVFVRHFPATALMASPVTEPNLMAALDEQESEVRQAVLRLVGSTGVAWEFVVRLGSPGEEIVKVAEEKSVDLIVIGSDRHSSLHNLLLGSTAAYVTTHSPSPVLVVRSAAQNKRAALMEVIRS
jgi:nucleotide-binding universal stress UspA family protein